MFLSYYKSRLRRYLARRLGVPEIPLALQRLKLNHFQPNLVFDIGAYRGDFATGVLEIWPRTQIACFEVLPQRVQELHGLAKLHSTIQVFPVLMGAATSEAIPLHESETASSILEERISQQFVTNYYPMRTVDEVVKINFSSQMPDLLKLDTQGYELEVLKGAEKSLSGIKVILAEVNLLDIHKNVPLVADVVSWLNERGWVVYDICGLTRRPLDQALWQADFIFVPATSELRADKRWKA